MSNISDYKVLFTEFTDGAKMKGDLEKFVKTVNSYLKNGYTLHGSTKGSFVEYGSCSQVVVKYLKPNTGPIIEKYCVVYGKFQKWGDDNHKIVGLMSFEKIISDSLREGWVLYGDTEYAYKHSDGLNNCFHSHWQTLVKYKQPEVNLLDI